MTQQRSHFFLNVDDDLRFAEIFRQLANLAAQLLVFFRQRIALGFAARVSAASGPRGCRLARSRRQLASCEEYKPSRRSSAPTPPGVAAGSLGLLQNALLVLRGEGTTLGLATTSESGRDEPSTGIGARFGWRCTALRLATLAFAPFRASQTPRRKNNTKRIPVHLCLFLSRPAH